MVKTKQQLVTSRALTYPGINGCKYITIHETANYEPGANAQSHANLQSNGFTASWHWQVDDKIAIKSFPHTVRCWHAGDGTGKGNFESIGIEVCVNADGDFKQAVANAAELTKMIMAEENISLANVVQHSKWSGKDCPHNLRNGSKGITWIEFINMVSDGTSTYTPPKQQIKPEKEKLFIQDAKWPKYGNKGPNVGTWQRKLRELGFYKGKIDNSFGPATDAATKSFQERYDLEQDGQAGPASNTKADQLIKKKKLKQTVHLPKTAKTWRTYKLNVQPVAKNSDWSLTPSRYGGLTYEILGKPYPDVVTINTSRGKRNIYVGKGTGVAIK